MIIDCEFLEPHQHEFPEDWIMGGADGLHPAADPRFQASVYVYYDEMMKHLHTTVAPLCDEQALDEFTKVATFGRNFNPTYVTVRRPGTTKAELLPWQYRKVTDTIRPIGGE